MKQAIALSTIVLDLSTRDELFRGLEVVGCIASITMWRRLASGHASVLSTIGSRWGHGYGHSRSRWPRRNFLARNNRGSLTSVQDSSGRALPVTCPFESWRAIEITPSPSAAAKLSNV